MRAEGRRVTESTTERILAGIVELRTTPHKDRCDPESERMWDDDAGGGPFTVGLRLGDGRPTGGAAAIMCAGSMSLKEVGETGDLAPGVVGIEGIVGNMRIGSSSKRR